MIRPCRSWVVGEREFRQSYNLTGLPKLRR